MVEGGATVIAHLLTREIHLVSQVVLTIAPLWLGNQGLSSVTSMDTCLAKLMYVTSAQLDQDVVIYGQTTTTDLRLVV